MQEVSLTFRPRRESNLKRTLRDGAKLSTRWVNPAALCRSTSLRRRRRSVGAARVARQDGGDCRWNELDLRVLNRPLLFAGDVGLNTYKPPDLSPTQCGRRHAAQTQEGTAENFRAGKSTLFGYSLHGASVFQGAGSGFDPQTFDRKRLIEVAANVVEQFGEAALGIAEFEQG